MLRPLMFSLMVLSALALTTPTWAHVGQSPALHPSAPTASEPAPQHAADSIETLLLVSPAGPARERPATQPPIGWIVLAVLAAGAAASRLSRRVVCTLTAVLLVSFAAETAVHSVHHLASASEMSRCSVASAASNLNGVLETPVTLDPSEEARGVTPALAPAVPPWW